MNHWNKMTNTLRYLAASLIVAIGLATLIGSSSSTEFPESMTLNLRADSNEVYLEWTPYYIADSYDVFRDRNPVGGTWFYWYSDISVSASTRYCYTISAIDESQVVAHSNTACITTPATGSWGFETIDDGNNPALALDSSNQPHISYRNSTGVVLAYKSGASWQQSVVDSGAGDAGDTDVAVDLVNADHVSYMDYINDRLMYASNGTGVWQTQTIDTSVAGINALSIDSAGYVHIVYNKDVTDLGVVSYATNITGSWQIETIAEFSNESINDADILVDAAGAVHLVFTSQLTSESEGCSVNYMTNQSGSWQGQVVDDNALCGVAMAMDNAENVHVVYSRSVANSSPAPLIHAYNSGGSWRFEQINGNSSSTYPEVDITIDGANRLHITYRADYSNVKYATKVNGVWEFTLLDSDRYGYKRKKGVGVAD